VTAARRRKRARRAGLFEAEAARGDVERQRGDGGVGGEGAPAGTIRVQALHVAAALGARLDAIDAAGLREALPIAFAAGRAVRATRRVERPLRGATSADE